VKSYAIYNYAVVNAIVKEHHVNVIMRIDYVIKRTMPSVV